MDWSFPPFAFSTPRFLRLTGWAGALLLGWAVAVPDASAAPVDQVVVNKTARKMMLLKDGEVIRTYRIALGANPVGHKQERGDERTPEGDYVLDYRNAGSKFHKSIHISYPNAADIAEARKRGVHPGGLIFIHGTPNRAPKNAVVQSLIKSVDWTDGCIAVNDREMDEIWTMVQNGTPIRIEP